MKLSFRYRFLGLEKIEFSYARCILLLLVLNIFASSASAQLDTELPPSGNFDLNCWKLTRPNQQEKDENILSNGYYVEGEFYTDSITGAMVFWCPNDGLTGGSTYPRNELREMMRCGDTNIGTQGINKNNWVFSSSSMENQEAAAGVDGIMTATVTVDHVSETSDASFKVGRTIIGQIHASDDEPCRLYYRKLPGHTKGSVYIAHEPTTSAEQWYDMIGSRSDNAPDPVDGIALGEKFSYEIKAIGNLLTVTIMREGMDDVVQEVDMTDSGFADDWMYFKAGNYNQNNAGDPGEYAQVSFYALEITHFAPTPPTTYEAPSDIPKFQPFLAGCKLQAPTSATLAHNSTLNNSYTHPQYFYVADDDKMLFNQSGDSRRTELRHETNWDLTQANRSLHGRIDIVEQTCEQVTIMQIHDDANAGAGPNKPLLRIYKHNGNFPTNHIWAAIKTDDGGANTTHIELGEDPGGYFNCDIRLVDGNMIIDFEGEEKVNMDVSYWTWPSYWKAGVYLQDDGEATAHFDELFEADGSPQNYVPTVSITDPVNGTNFLPGSDITINVDAEDSDGTVTKVEFFEGGSNLLGVDSIAPYSFTWIGPANGAYTLTAMATDNVGGSKTSLSSNITVQIPIDVTGVDLKELTGPIAVGASIQLEALVAPGNATNQNVIFESDDASIATITDSGLLSAISEGVFTITVTTADGGFMDEQTIEVLTPSNDVNLALDKPVVGTGIADGNNTPSNLVDEDTDTRWSVQDFPQSATIDLLGFMTITQTEITCYQDRAYHLLIEGAIEQDGPFTTIIDRTNNNIPGTATAPIINSIDSVEARYLRVTVSGAEVYDGSWVSLTEVKVFGEGEQIFTSVNELVDEKVRIFPNPASSIVTIEAGREYETVSVFDLTGKMVMQRTINTLTTLDISGLQSGLYMLRLEGNDSPVVRKFIKQ